MAPAKNFRIFCGVFQIFTLKKIWQKPFIKKMLPFVFVALILLLLPILHDLIFPLRKPDLEHYFSPGDSFSSSAEGITQTIIRSEGGRVYSELRLEPWAAGPPEHMHLGFDECLAVTSGVLTTTADGKIRKIPAGGRLEIPRGVYHRMYNETAEPVVLRSEKEGDYIPVEFAWSLAQLYPLMGRKGGLTLPMFLKLCALDTFFDSFPKGPPPAVLKGVKRLVRPYARLLGYSAGTAARF